MESTSPEMLLVGSIFQSPHLYYTAVEQGITTESFSTPEAILLWMVSEEIITKTGSIDRYSILTELHQRKHKAALELVDSIPADVLPDTGLIHMEAVRKSEKQRKMARVMRQFSKESGDPDQLITSMASELMGILHNTSTHRVKTFADIEPDVWKELEQIRAGKGDYLIGYPSFISPANFWAVHYPKGKVSVVAAYRNTGKSTLAKQEILHLARSGIKVGLITMEDTSRDVYTNTVTVDGAGWMWKYQQGSGDMLSFKRHSDAIKDLPIYVVDAPQTISEWEASATLLVARYGVEMLFTDHLHEIMPDRGVRYSNIDDKYTAFIESIVATTKRLNIGHCLYAQFSRDCEKEGRAPRMSDLKGSSSIEQKARRIYTLYKDPESDGFIYEGSKISNSAAKSREDRIVKLRFSPHHDGFEVV